TFKYPEGYRAGVEGGVQGGVVGGALGGLADRVARQAPAAPPPPPATVMPAPMMEGRARAEQVAPAGFAAESVAVEKERKETAWGASGPVVVLKAWDPSTPYLRAIKQARPGEAYAVFLAHRREYGGSPAFYLDCADYFLRAGPREIGLRVLSDVLELQLEEPRLLRIAAHRLRQAGELDAAVEIFEKVLRMRPEEPQSLRDLALALEARADARRERAGKGSPAIAADYLRSVQLLDRIVLGEWDARFPEIEVMALEEANRIIALVERDPSFGRATFPVDARLRKLLD